ncbi:MAG: hypothetical protein EYC68_05470 [Chloroflexota bacterium]|nr:MAG: hypothetical protein EYC68_05470 [Chloroflexota bacterium]
MKKAIFVLALTLGVLFATFGSQNRALAAPPNSTPVWRAQLRLAIANVSDAGTDDDVQIQLNVKNSTWLDYARNDFERNKTYTYDLSLTKVTKLGEITKLRIRKTGTDAICVRSITLLINGKTIYSKTFGNAQSTCLWLDNGDGHPNSYSVSGATLRAHASWKGFVQPNVPTTLTRSELESRIEGAVGDRIQSNDLMWGDESYNLFGRGVEVTKKTNESVHVDLDLAYDLPGPYNPEVDVDFDLAFSCSSGKVTATAENYDAHLDSIIYDYLKNLLPVWGPKLLDMLTKQVLKGMVDAISISGQFGGSCPVISVTGDGNVVFSKP